MGKLQYHFVHCLSRFLHSSRNTYYVLITYHVVITYFLATVYYLRVRYRSMLHSWYKEAEKIAISWRWKWSWWLRVWSTVEAAACKGTSTNTMGWYGQGWGRWRRRRVGSQCWILCLVLRTFLCNNLISIYSLFIISFWFFIFASKTWYTTCIMNLFLNYSKK